MTSYICVKLLDIIIIGLIIYLSIAFLLFGIPFINKNIYSLGFFAIFYFVDEKLLI
jgi:hypothetical protein